MVGHSTLNEHGGSQAPLTKLHQNSSNAIVKHTKSSEKAGESTIGLKTSDNKVISGSIKTMGNSTTPQNYKKSLFHQDKKTLVEVKESEDDLVATQKFGVTELQKDIDSQANHDSMILQGAQPLEYRNISPFRTPIFNNVAPQLDIVLEKIEEEKEKIK